MDRRSFFVRREPSPPRVSEPLSEWGEPLEALPGQPVPHAVAARWRAPRTAPTTAERDTAQRGPGGVAPKTTAGLEPYAPTAEAPWTRARARHLLRRTGFGATARAVTQLHAMSPGDAVDALLDGAAGLPPVPDPAWRDDAPPHWSAPDEEQQAYRDLNDARIEDYGREVVHGLISTGISDELAAACVGFRESLALMWHNHVVTDLEAHFLAPWLFRYWSMLRRHAFGDVRSLIDEAGRDPSMLVYLNGLENRAGEPNENYARELFELFTMGIQAPDGAPNYTQTDVTEAARALTGWGVDYFGQTDTPLDGVFVPEWHDGGQKTIFGQTGPWGHADVVRLVFEQRAEASAHFVCRKLYRTYVHHVPDEAIVAQLAQRLLDADFQMMPVLRVLFRSQHFFDQALIGGAIRSPLQGILGLWRELGMDAEQESDEDDFPLGYYWAAHLAGQRLFYPPNVAGWPGGRTWIDTSRLSTRWTTVNWVVWRQDVYRELTRAYPTPVRVSARQLTRAMADDWLGLPVGDARIDELVALLLNGQDEQYWDPDDPSAEYRLRGLVRRFAELPEYQLG